MQLVLNTYGLQLNQLNRCFQVQSKTESRLISPVRITSILITKATNITSSALLLAAEYNIPVVFVNSAGQPVVKTEPVLITGVSELRKKQYAFTMHPNSVTWVIQLVLQKTEGQIANLAFWSERYKELRETFELSRISLAGSLKGLPERVNKMKDRQQILQFLRGWEGNNAKIYWRSVAGLALHLGWHMKGRSYKPADDEVNAILNYIYGMLYHQVQCGLAAAGLDSQLGIWHRDEFQTPSLSFDIIEPLRPGADRFLAEFLSLTEYKSELFESDVKYGCILSKPGRMLIIPKFNGWLEEKIKMQGQVTQVKNHILDQAFRLRKEIEKTELYEPE